MEGHGEEGEIVQEDVPDDQKDERPGKWYVVKMTASRHQWIVHETELRPA